MKQKIIEVVSHAAQDAIITNRPVAPKAVFKPEGREDEGIILRVVGGVNPHIDEAARFLHGLVGGEPLVIIPDENAPQGRKKDKKRKQDDGKGRCPAFNGFILGEAIGHGNPW